jgi:hypothetical protein
MELLNDDERRFVEQILDEDLRFRGLDSNLGFVIEAIETTNSRGEQLTETVVRRAISNVGGQLAANASYAKAFHQFFMLYPSLNLTANELLLADAHRAIFGPRTDLTSENLEVIARGSRMQEKLAVTQQYKEELAAEDAALQQSRVTAREAASMIVQMTAYLLTDGEIKGRTQYDKLVNKKRLNKETAELSTLSREELLERYSAWKYKKDLEGMSVEDVRKIVQQDDKQRRAAFTEFLPIPASYSPPGKPDVHIPWSTELFKKLPILEKKRLFKLFGEAQLNAAVNGGN